MKKLLKLIVYIIICVIIGLVINYVLSLLEEQATNNRSDLEQIEGSGDLVSNDEVANLEDSGITGDGYTFSATYYPYYNMLDTNAQALYKQIYANIEELSTTFVPTVTIKVADVEDIIEAVFNDHPELFWIETSYSYKYTSDGRCVQIILNFNDTVNNFSASKAAFESAANSIISTAQTLSTNYEKEKYVHDTLIELIDYNDNASLNQSAYSALVNHSSVCAGYARAFQYIMIELGIPTYYVTGTASGDHAWNIVTLSDGYYNVDLTWDDSNGVSYTYFNITDSVFNQTHTRTGLSVNLPTCNATTYSNLESTSAKSTKEKNTLNNTRSNEEINQQQTGNNLTIGYVPDKEKTPEIRENDYAIDMPWHQLLTRR